MNTKSAFDYLSGRSKFDPVSAAEFSLRGATEGIVLLENKNNALPLSLSERIAFFGRMQKEYLLLGTGSGGRVEPPYVTNVFDSLSEMGAQLDSEVEAFYNAFVAENPYEGLGQWSHPASQAEPLLEEGFVASAADRNDAALYIITRTAGEDCDLKAVEGGFSLTETEIINLNLIRKSFKKFIVLLNVCGVIEFKDITAASPDAIVMLWTGGMMGGKAAARVLLGEENPCGRLPDTIASARADYITAQNYGTTDKILYQEDVFVGYRYFNTFAEDKILYPFGYGLSYTEFGIYFIDIHRNNGVTKLRIVASNLGTVAGREVVQCYVNLPCGKLGNPKKVLAAFAKTPILAPGESTTLELSFDDYSIASYDDSGVSGYKYSWVLEAGEYVINIGKNSCDTTESCSFTVKEDMVLKTCESALAPTRHFDRFVNRSGYMVTEPVPVRVPKAEPIPETIPQVEKDGATLADVVSGKLTMKEFVARFSDKDLIHIVRAEGMASPKASPGNAAAFVGITPSLKALGLPVVSCIDGPSGIRSVNNEKRICYPAATCLAATWDTELLEAMYHCCGNELASDGIDILLGPSTNIHRDPLCGRNFEYFSEDPLLSGKLAAAICRGLDAAGVSGAVKHFMANNQETNRYGVDSVISERAIRQIYAKPFEICVNESPVRSVMTSYNPINGRWAASNYDLTVRLLRNDFGFKGFVMTDWWAKVNEVDAEDGCVTNLAGMVHAMNDIYMVCPDALTREDNLEAALENGTLSRGELQTCAINLLNFTVDSLSYMAMREGLGMRDLKNECEGKAPFAVAEVVDGEAVFNLDITEKAIVRVTFVSDTPVLTQSSISLTVNTKNAGGFIVGGTEGKTVCDYREIGVITGENKFVFSSETPLAKAVSVEIFR
ncbi:MAG: glycoside hydrolase family 3 protein [Clostridia bacterium]|nr:glycoside hydrolase family 3 protein [Clostridia bacterium]